MFKPTPDSLAKKVSISHEDMDPFGILEAVSIGQAFLHFPTSSHFPPAVKTLGTFHWPIRTPRFQRSKPTWNSRCQPNEPNQTYDNMRCLWRTRSDQWKSWRSCLLGLSALRIRTTGIKTEVLMGESSIIVYCHVWLPEGISRYIPLITLKHH